MPLAAIANIPVQTLDEALALVDRRFDTQAILDRPLGREEVADYYRQSDRGYRWLHSREGALHIALGCDGRRDTSGYPRQAQILVEHLDAINAARVVEFGSGMGYNVRWLAGNCPERQFLGVDLTASHVRLASKRAEKLPNARYEVGNYEQLPFDNGAFDAVFAVETLCQTDSQDRAIREACRVLRPGGRLVVVDCFRAAPLESLPPNLQRASRLVEKTTAVNAFAEVDAWIALAESAGLQLVENRDLSEETEQNLARLYSLAVRFFKMSLVARTAAKVLPAKLKENAICGLLMPFTVGLGAQTYRAIAVEKPQ